MKLQARRDQREFSLHDEPTLFRNAALHSKLVPTMEKQTERLTSVEKSRLGNLAAAAQDLAAKARVDVLKMISSAKAAHVGSSLSVIDILASAYSVYAFEPSTPTPGHSQTRLVFSKGHAAAALYAVLAHKGAFPLSWLERYCANGAELGGHATHGIPGVEFSSGSLGHGLPYAVGLALMKKRSGQAGKTVVVMSDGELNEGSNWEALLLAAHHELTSLEIFVDRNRQQSFGDTETTLALEPLDRKFEAFGWHAAALDGHSHEELCDFMSSQATRARPTVAICRTVKGKGVSFMEDDTVWHYRPPNPEELAQALAEQGSTS